jgi:hypothetical protein
MGPPALGRALLGFLDDASDISHRDGGLTNLVSVARIHVNLKGSNVPVGHPIDGGSLTASIGPDRDGTFSAREGGAGPIDWKAKYYIGALDRTIVLVLHLNYERSHYPALQIILLPFAGQHEDLQVLLNGQLRQGLRWRWIRCCGRGAGLRSGGRRLWRRGSRFPGLNLSNHKEHRQTLRQPATPQPSA